MRLLLIPMQKSVKDGVLAVAIGMQEEKIGVINSNQLPNLDMEKHRHDDVLSASNSTPQQQQSRKEQKNQCKAQIEASNP